MTAVWQITWSENEDTTHKVEMMNRTRDMLKAYRPSLGRTLPNLKTKGTEIPKFPPCSGDSALYIEEIHYRAQTVTPILKAIPGYLLGHDKN